MAWNAPLAKHLAKGAIALGAIVASFLTAGSGWPSFALLGLGFVLMGGCPTCWLAEFANLTGGDPERYCADGGCTVTPRAGTSAEAPSPADR